MYLKTSIAHERLGFLSYSPLSPILSHPVTQLWSPDFHLRAETYAQLYSVWLSCQSGRMRGSCLPIRLTQMYLCSSPLLPFFTQVQMQTSGLVKTHGFSLLGWTRGWAPSAQHLLKLL